MINSLKQVVHLSVATAEDLGVVNIGCTHGRWLQPHPLGNLVELGRESRRLSY